MGNRKRYSSQEKVNILRAHFEQNEPVPDLCEKHRIHPNQFYRWKKEFFEKAAEVFTSRRDGRDERRRIDQLQCRLKDRNEVIAELLEENLKLKKSAGEI